MSILMLFLATLVGSLPNTSSSDWRLAKDAKSVKVYTRYIAGYSIKEFKGETVLNATLDQMVSILKDGASYKSWMYNTSESKLLNTVSPSELYIYTVTDSPWPVSDRDNIMQLKFEYPEDNVVVAQMRAKPTYVPKKSGMVRIETLKGFWRLEQLSNGQLKVSQQVLAEPGGSIPAWLANSYVVDSPYNTLLNLRKKF